MSPTRHFLTGAGLVLLLAAIPVATYLSDAVFTVTFATRILILATAAVSLNLVLGYGGLLSLCHSAFVGIGAYVVGIASYHAFNDGQAWMANGFLQLVAVLAFSSIVAGIIGAISLRTKGIYFLMITMAFGQTLYLAAVGAELYGGDDGMTIFQPSLFGSFALEGRYVMYIAAAILFCLAVLLVDRLARSRFGLVLQAAKMNETRVRALGYDPVRVRLLAFVISGALAGLAGFLLANYTQFVSPGELSWIRSGDLVIMVVLGGLGLSLGPLFGAAFLLIVEELAPGITSYWPIIVGVLVLLVALYAPRGLGGLLSSEARHD